MQTSWLLKHGTIIDGSGRAPFPGDVFIEGEKISAVGKFNSPADVRTIDCTGLVISPGFIDAHSHSDLQVLEGRREKRRQGVTTEVVGNCGFSAYPPAADPAVLRDFANGILFGDQAWGWPSSNAYLREIERSRTANVASLVGHGTLRIAAAGNKQGPLEESQICHMEDLLAEAFTAGATGFSTGLMYAPGSSAPQDELIRLCKVVARHEKVYTSHIRSYFSELVPAIEEQVELARRAGCRLQISHLQAVGATNWPEHVRALEAIERAKSEGIDIAFDCYPYVAGSSVLTQLLPQWALDGGTEAMLSRLKDDSQRKVIADEIVATIAWRWQDVFISAVSSSTNAARVGLNLQEIADDRKCQPLDAMLDLLLDENGQVNMISFNQSEENLRLSLTHPLAIIISDGFYVKGRPHPRLHGTFPLLLGTICRERQWLTLQEAIHKVTLRAAERFHLQDRGILRPRAFADVTIFDREQVNSPATYEQPELPPIGIVHVFRNGRPEEGLLQ